ncbi:MAG: hypothetical protein AB8B65_13475 [Kordia sp.]|uniref:hypothetical protein n=1 Tax=Kordia sp. TaxID=1965332 RepID=UPI00385D2C62
MKQQKRIQFKQGLSIAIIGKLQFWIGILLGVFNAVVFYLFIFYLLDFMNLFNISMDGDLPLQTKDRSFFETPFLAATSFSLGVTMMIRHWFMQPTFRYQRSCKNISLRISNYSLFIFYLVLYAAIVYIRFFVFGKTFTEADRPINYTSLFFTIPLYLFFVAWTEVSRHFVAKKWIISTFLIGTLTVFLFTITNIKPTKFSEKTFNIIHAEEFEYVDTELKKATEKYNIHFSEETINALKEFRSKRAFELLEKVRLAFKADKKVSLDTIILEKILIHNFKGYYKGRRDSYTYIFPFQAYEQLRKVAPKSDEATELIFILEEFYKLSKLKTEDWISDNNSFLYHNRMSILEYQFHDYNPHEYYKMYDQVFFLLPNIQKLKIYDHPLFNKEIPFPPSIPIFEKNVLEKFPEFTHQTK